MTLEFHERNEGDANDRPDAQSTGQSTVVFPDDNQRPATKDEPVSIKCIACNAHNPHDTDYCTDCGTVTSLAAAYRHQQGHVLQERINATLVHTLLEQGLLDDAIRAAHDARLGETLRRIATNDFTPIPRAADEHGNPIIVNQNCPDLPPNGVQ